MPTTYQAAFGNPQHHLAVMQDLVSRVTGKPRDKPDTSNDAALARAIAEEERAAAGQGRDLPASPSGVKVHLAGSAEVPSTSSPPPDARHQRSYSDGGAARVQAQLAHLAHPGLGARGSTGGAGPANGRDAAEPHGGGGGGPAPTSRQVVSDAELAAKLQRVELDAVADATGGPPSLMFPDLMSQPSSRELMLGRTLSRAPSIMGAPRVLSSVPPSEPVVSADRQRLLVTLKLYELVERQVAGDGNCQFRALSDQLYNTPEHHDVVRASIVATLRQQATSYSGYVPQAYSEYCDLMAKPGTWGDHVTLKAAADTYGMRIVVVSSFADSPVITIEAERKLSSRSLFLSFWAELHYNSLYPAQEPPPSLPPAPAAATVAEKPSKVLGSRKLGSLFGV